MFGLWVSLSVCPPTTFLTVCVIKALSRAYVAPERFSQNIRLQMLADCSNHAEAIKTALSGIQSASVHRKSVQTANSLGERVYRQRSEEHVFPVGLV